MTEYRQWEEPESGHISPRRVRQKHNSVWMLTWTFLCRCAPCLFKPETRGTDFRTKAMNFLSEICSFHLSKEEFCCLIFKISCLRRAPSSFIISSSPSGQHWGQAARSPLSSSKDLTPEHPEAFWEIIICDHQAGRERMKATDDGSKQFPISVDMPEADPPPPLLFAFLPRCSRIMLCTEGVSHARVGMSAHSLHSGQLQVKSELSSLRAKQKHFQSHGSVMSSFYVRMQVCECVRGGARSTEANASGWHKHGRLTAETSSWNLLAQ